MNIYRDIPDQRTLEREYSPSSCVQDLNTFLVQYVTRSESARVQLGTPAVHQYGMSAVEALDFFPAAGPGAARPLLVYIHGGYWQELSKNEHAFPATALNRNAVSYCAVNYGLAPEATLDEMVERCRRALAWIARHCTQLDIDPNAIHVAGSSAGAHLTAMVGLTDWRRYGLDADPIRSVILLSGVFDLRPLPLTYINDAVRMSPEDALRNSPALLVETAGVFPPALVAYGDNETAEFKRQSNEFAAALGRKRGAVTLHEIAGRNHFDLPFDIGDETTPFGRLTLQHIDAQQRAGSELVSR
jgi:arylformamidase